MGLRLAVCFGYCIFAVILLYLGSLIASLQACLIVTWSCIMRCIASFLFDLFCIIRISKFSWQWSAWFSVHDYHLSSAIRVRTQQSRCTTNKIFEDFWHLELCYYHPNNILSSSEKVPPTSHINNLGKTAKSTDIKSRGTGRKVALSGDGRADSPGHSAKHGSYTVVETMCNKVVDYQLVLVCIN